MAQYSPIVTLNGQGKVAAAIANETAVNISHLAIGDGDGAPVTPVETQTELVNEVWRGAVQSVARDPVHPTQVIITAAVPVDVGPFVIREMGLIAADGSLFAVQGTPEIEKTTAAQGATQDITVRFRVVVATTANITITVDPSTLVPVSGLARAPFIAIDSFSNAPPANPALGALVVVGPAPTGAFAGLAHRFAQWMGSFWVNCVAPQETIVGNISNGLFYRRTATGWVALNWALWLTEDKTITVGPAGEFADPQAAIDSLDLWLFKPGIFIDIEFAGVDFARNAPLVIRHMQASQIRLKGAAPAGGGAFGVNAARATTEANARAVYSTTFVLADNIGAGIECVNGTIGRIENILFVGNGGANAPVGVRIGRQTLTGPFDEDTAIGPGRAVLQRVAGVGCLSTLLAAAMSHVSCYALYAGNCYSFGVRSINSANITGDVMHLWHNGQGGAEGADNSKLEFSNSNIRNNTGHGMLVFNDASLTVRDSTIANNTAYQITALDDSSFVVTGSNLSAVGGTGSAFANQGAHGRIGAGCSNVSGLSPAANTVGNNNSFIAQ